MKILGPLAVGGIVVIAVAVFLSQRTVSSQNETGAVPTPVTTNAVMLETPSRFETTANDVRYFRTVNGYFAKPVIDGDYPGVVMVHEWWGLNDNIKDMAKQLASQGYRVLAVDLYNGTVAQTPEEARRQTSALDKEEAVNNMKAARQYLQDQGAEKIAGLGWCFGGGQSLQLALSGTPLDATVIYYGTLETDQNKLAAITWPVLGIFGDKDQSIPVGTVRQFEAALDNQGIENEIYVYPGVGHAFANPSGDNYAPDETKDAWSKTLVFLKKHLKG